MDLSATQISNIETLALSSGVFLTVTVGFLLNAFALIVFAAERSLHKINYLLIVLLCGAECCACFGYMISSSMRITTIQNVTEPLTKFNCVSVDLPQIVGSLLMEIATLAIAVDRFILVIFPLIYHNEKHKISYGLFGASIVVALVIGLSALIGDSMTAVVATCLLSKALSTAYYSFYAIVQLAFSFTAIVLYGLGIAINRWRLKQHVAATVSEQQKDQKAAKHAEREKKMVKLINALLIAYLFTTLPSCVCRLLSIWVTNSYASSAFSQLASILTGADAISNFTLYLTKHQEIRGGVKQFVALLKYKLKLADSPAVAAAAARRGTATWATSVVTRL